MVLRLLPEPAMFLKRIGECLNTEGVFIGLVPLNERIMDPHHFQRLNHSKILGFAQAVSLGLGLPATVLGPRLWFALGRCYGFLTRSKPAQAAFILARP